MTKSFSIRSLFLFVGLVAVLATVLWLVILAQVGVETSQSRSQMLVELSKTLSQFVLISIIGALASFGYTQYAKMQEQKRFKLEEDNKLRRELLGLLIAVRARVEKNRRGYQLLPISERAEGYRCCIEEILEARLQISEVWHDSQTFQDLYGQDTETIQGHLLEMKEFLDTIIEEYEKFMRGSGNHRSEQAIDGLQHFGTFIVGTGGQEYEGGFLKDYRSAAGLIRKHLMTSGTESA